MTAPKAKTLRNLRINRVASVDRGAGEGVQVVLMKRDFSADERKAYADKGIAMPGGDYPIPDTASLHDAIQAFGRAKDKAATKAHIITRAKALGATDQLPESWAVSKAGEPGSTTDNEGDPMSSAIKKALGLPDTASDAEVETAIAKVSEAAGKLPEVMKLLEIAKAMAEATPEEKAYIVAKAMTDGAAADWLKKPKDEKAADCKKHADGDESLTLYGQTVKKSVVGEATFQIMKGQAEEIKANKEAFEKAQNIAKEATFAKRAVDEFAHVAGSVEDRAAVIKLFDGADEKTKAAGEAILKAAEGAAKLAFKKVGAGGGEGQADGASAEGKLEKLAKSREEASAGKLTFAKAYDQVIKENPALYEEALAAKPVAAV